MDIAKAKARFAQIKKQEKQLAIQLKQIMDASEGRLTREQARAILEKREFLKRVV
jgi:hypothetical protein